MATNDFQTFASASGANVITQSAYTSLSAQQTGFQSGTAQSNQANKVWRQASIISSMIGQFIANTSGQNAVDDGTITTLLANFLTSIQIASGRTKLTTTLNMFVSPAGSDSNNGLTQSTPFQTIQAAWNALTHSYDLNGYPVTINLANGTYALGLAAYGKLVGQVGPVSIVGNTTSPGSVIINSASGQVNTFVVQGGAYIAVSGMTLNSSGSGQGGYCLVSQLAANLLFSNVIFGTAPSGHIIANIGGFIQGTGNYTISGSAGSHVIAATGGSINFDAIGSSYTVTLTGTPNFNTFAFADGGGYLAFTNTGYSGSATGSKYLISNGGYINTGGAGANYFPGSTAGTITAGYYV